MEFSANIANLGKYNAGVLAAAWLSFPATTEQVQSVLREIGVDGLRYEETIVLEYSTSVKGLAGRLGEFVPIDELNYLASRIGAMTPQETEKFTAAVSHGEYGDSMKDLINLTYNLDCYDFLPDVRTEEEYGRWLVDHRQEFRLPEKAKLYFDYESYGGDASINEGGDFSELGYIFNNRTAFQAVYDGLFECDPLHRRGDHQCHPAASAGADQGRAVPGARAENGSSKIQEKEVTD